MPWHVVVCAAQLSNAETGCWGPLNTTHPLHNQPCRAAEPADGQHPSFHLLVAPTTRALLHASVQAHPPPANSVLAIFPWNLAESSEGGMWFFTIFRLTHGAETLAMNVWDTPFKSKDRDLVLPVQAAHLQANMSTAELPCHADEVLIVAHRLRSPAMMKALSIDLAFWRIPRLLMVIKPLDGMIPPVYSVDELRNHGKVYWAVVLGGLVTITSTVARIICNFKGTKQSIRGVDYPQNTHTRLVLTGAEEGRSTMEHNREELRVATHAPTLEIDDAPRAMKNKDCPHDRYPATVDDNGRKHCGKCGEFS